MAASDDGLRVELAPLAPAAVALLGLAAAAPRGSDMLAGVVPEPTGCVPVPASTPPELRGCAARWHTLPPGLTLV